MTSPIQSSRRPEPAGYLACALAGVFWGLGFFFGKIAFAQFTVEHYLFYRFLFACAALLPFMRHPHFSARQWGLLLIAAALGIPLQFMVQFYGLSLTSVSHAALMVGSMPVILAAGATWFAGEQLELKGWLALIVSTAGIVLIVRSSPLAADSATSGSTRGDLLVIASLFIALAWVLLNKRLMAEGCSPFNVTAWGVLAGSIMLYLWTISSKGLPPLRGIHPAVWLAAAGSGFSAPRAACCCGTGACIVSPLREPPCSSILNRRWVQCWVFSCWASGWVPLPGLAEP